MGWVKKWKSKNVKLDRIPDTIGVCDDSGFAFNHKDLKPQQEWRGDRLVWNGLMKGPQYLDEPQEQNRPPLVKHDPTILVNPRPIQVGPPATFGRTPGQIAPQDPPYSTIDVPQVPPYQQLLNKLNDFNWNEE